MGSGETDGVEFKSTLRTNLHTGERDGRMESTVLRTIAGFLNMSGGTLIVGIADDGSPVGLQPDGFADEDKMTLRLINLLKDRLGGEHAISIHPRFDDHAGVRVLVVECDRSRIPVFVKDGQTERLRALRTLDAGTNRRSSTGIHPAALLVIAHAATRRRYEAHGAHFFCK